MVGGFIVVVRYCEGPFVALPLVLRVSYAEDGEFGHCLYSPLSRIVEDSSRSSLLLAHARFSSSSSCLPR